MRHLFVVVALAFAALTAPVYANTPAVKTVESVAATKTEAKININTATAKDLAKAMKGIGIKKAETIVAHREANGPFKSVEDLLKVKGVGPATLQKNAAKLAIN